MPGRKEAEETRREEILRAAYDVAARRGVEALTLRAVAERAAVSHGTVLFHFSTRDELVALLLDRVLYATTSLRIPDDVGRRTRPSERMLALMRTEMDRLSTEPRHFRLFLEYWALGLRRPALRRRVVASLDAYRAEFRKLAETLEEKSPAGKSTDRAGRAASTGVTPAGLAAAAVSLVHGCALQAVVAPGTFDIEQHFLAASRLFDGYR